MIIRDAVDADLDGILEIYNEAVRNTTALWNSATVGIENRRAWLAGRRAQGYPVLVAMEDDRVVGYASFGDWRPFDGYRFTVEHSVYVHCDRQGRGIGHALLALLIERASGLGKHVMVAAIEASNTASLRLHARLGFVQTANMPQVGTKFGRWLDLVFMQLVLDDREAPSA